MDSPSPVEQTIAKLALLAKEHGLSVDDLIEMLNSGVSMADLLRCLTPKSVGSRH
jgi:hypothetical protein